MSTPGSSSSAKPAAGAKGANYHRQCTGRALETVQKREAEAIKDGLDRSGITLFGAAFCPFVHRVWMAFEYLGIVYRYVEVDPYAKPAELLEVNEKGLVPSLRIVSIDTPREAEQDPLDDSDEQYMEEADKQKQHRLAKGLAESTVIMEYLQEYSEATSSALRMWDSRSLLPRNSPRDVYQRGKARQIAHHLNNTLVPSFYRFLQAQEQEKQVEFGKEFVDNLKWFEARLIENDDQGGETQHNHFGLKNRNFDGHKKGDFFGAKVDLGWVDVMIAPWAFRATNVLSEW